MDITKDDIGICDNNCIDCNVICNGKHECNHIFRCIYYMLDIMQEILIPLKNITNIICEKMEACKEMTVNLKGYFNYGGSIDLIGSR